MAHIMHEQDCEDLHFCHCGGECPYECPDYVSNCLECMVHCPCCKGWESGLCNQCSEENCDNRSLHYDPNSVSKQEE